MNYLDNLGKTYVSAQGTASIEGQKGPYNNKISNESVRYGRNAAAKYNSYVENYNSKPLDPKQYDLSGLTKLNDDQFEKKINTTSKAIDEDMSVPLTPIKFNYKYLPEEKVDPKNINKMALLGAAFEELGKKLSVSTSELTEKWQLTLSKMSINAPLSADSVDINKDGQVDAGEYASTILLADMLSTDAQNVDANNIKGEINNSGQNNSLPYLNKKNIAPATEMFKTIYNAFGLEQANKEFASNQNNLA